MILDIYQRHFLGFYLVVLVCLFFVFPLSAQVAFEQNDTYFNFSEKSIYAVGFTDLNGDFHDDLILTPDGRGLNIYYQSGSTSYALRDNNSFGYPSMITTVTSADLDHNGRDEILISGSYNDTYIYKYNENRYSRDTILTDSVYAQGSNSVDIDNDGFLDFFICHDDANNVVYKNDGFGKLRYDVSNIVLPVDETLDNSGNYGSEWIDFDDDGDLDLYIAKCRLGVTDTNDIRRKNALYINDGNSLYTEQADVYNLGSGWQSWLSQWGDVDNDGDLDVMIFNHDYHHQLFRNVNGVFLEDTLFAGNVLDDLAWQGIMQDFDNDGNLDVLVCGSINYILWNDGTGNFTRMENPFGPVDAYSGAVGDFNADGFLDVLTTNVGQINDRIYESVTNNNNFIKFSLNGLVSNKEGIGSTVLIYGPWGVQRRDIKSGESYGIINSSTAHFGLSQNTSVDSIIVKWPSGIKDKFIPNVINEHYIITEGQCIYALAGIEYDEDLNLCGEDSIILKSMIDSPDIIWSNGIMGQNEIVVFESGPYSYSIKDPISECILQSELVYVREFPERPIVDIISNQDPVICNGSSLQLSVAVYDTIIWSTGDNISTIEVSESGWYEVTVTDICSDLQSDSVFISKIDPLLPVVMGDSLTAFGNAALSANGDSLHWYGDLLSDQVLSVEPQYFPYVEETTSFYVSNIESKILPSVSVGEHRHTGQTMFSNDAINAGMGINPKAKCTIKSIDVYSDLSGSRTFKLYDALFMNTVYGSYSMIIPADEWTTVPLNFELDPSISYILTTDEDLNIQNLGHAGPRLARSYDVPLEYPYVLEDILELSPFIFGSEYYYYFYNWQIEKPAVSCESDRIEVIAFVDDDVSATELDGDRISVYPNPSNERLILDRTLSTNYINYEILDIRGRNIMKGIHFGEIDISGLDRGTYFLKLSNRETAKVFRKKIVKIN